MGLPKHVFPYLSPQSGGVPLLDLHREEARAGNKKEIRSKEGSSLACLLRFSPVHTYMYTTKPLNDLAGFSHPEASGFPCTLLTNGQFVITYP